MDRIISILSVASMIVLLTACGISKNKTNINDAKLPVTAQEDTQSNYKSSVNVVYENSHVICIEECEYWNDWGASHPVIEVVHHTYSTDSGEELTLMDVTGMSVDAVADEIRRQLKDNYPELYAMYWGNENAAYKSYRNYYQTLEPSKLDFSLNANGTVNVYDTWMLDYATNPQGSIMVVINADEEIR